MDGLLAGLPDLKLGEAGQAHGNTFPPEGHPAVQHLLAGHVEGVRACLSCQSRKIGRGHARTHQDLKVRSGGLHQPTEQGSARRGAGGLPAGQDGAKVQRFGRFQRRKGVFADIKGTVQGADDRTASGLCSGRAAA